MSYTFNPILGLPYVNNGFPTARWNIPLADGAPVGGTGGIGGGTTVTFSFESDEPGYVTAMPDKTGYTNITGFPEDYKDAAREALAHIQSLTNLQFTEVTTGEGMIAFRHSTQDTGGFAYSPSWNHFITGGLYDGPYTPHQQAGDVWIDNGFLHPAGELVPGQRGFLLMLHELGHAMGLQHSFHFGANPPPYVMDPSLDNEAHTVMSYTAGPKTTLLTVTGTSSSWTSQYSFLSAGTMMPLDIEALQFLYGRNMSHNDTATRYHWTTNEEFLETIWDGGGVDTIDCSNQVFK